MSTRPITEPVESTETSLPKRLSRRALMKAAAIAPIIAAGRHAWATASPASMYALAAVAPMPSEDVAYVRQKSKEAFPTIDEDRVEMVWRVLWSHFQVGLAGVQPAENVSLTRTAFETKITDSEITTGARLADNINRGTFDPLGSDYQTNVCVYICAHKAALLACASPDKKVTVAIYQEARAATQVEMSSKLECARSFGGGLGTSPPSLGFGC